MVLSPRFARPSKRAFARRARRIGKLTLVVVVLSALLWTVPTPPRVTALSADYGDGILTYGQVANTTPQVRTYGATGNSFSAAASTVAGITGVTFITRTSPTKQEALTGYVDASGVLQVMCFDGNTWTNEWSVTVGGAEASRRFDIAYETNSGDAVVLYSTNTATTNELAYRTHPGTSGCNSGWSSATSLDPVRTSAVVFWVKAAWDRRASSNLITAIWADTSADLSAMTWSGSAWGNEPSAALETALDYDLASGDGGGLDVEYESLSGDVMVMWARRVAGNANGAYYATCTGGVSGCTWGSVTAWNATGDRALNLDISANPSTDELVFASVGFDGTTNGDLQAGYWSGSAWTNSPNKDTSALTPSSLSNLVSTGWLVSGSTYRSVVAYADATATTTRISWYYGDTGTFTAGTDFAGAPVPGIFEWFDIQSDPRNPDRLMLLHSDTNSALFAKRMVMNSGSSFTWTNADGSAALESAISCIGPPAFSFAYWRAPQHLIQNTYRWYQNTDAVQPTTAYAAENTSYSFNGTSTPVRLRQNVTVTDSNLAASAQDFKLQYATSTGGSWTDVASSAAWCNTVTPLCDTNWTARRKLAFNNSASTTNLSNFTVLLALSSSNIDYSKTQNSGQDLRFTDPNGTALNYEIELWNESGTSYVWVQVPQIDATSTTDYIWLYYGYASASAGQNKNATWDSNFKGVWHMDTDPTVACDGGSKELCDSTSNANNGDSAGAMTSGDLATAKVGNGIDFDGSNDEFVIPDANSLDVSEYTISAWYKPYDVARGYESILFKQNNYTLQQTDAEFSASISSGGTWYELIGSGNNSTANTWYYVTAVFDTTTNQIKLSVNGVSRGTQAETHNLTGNTDNLEIGATISSMEFLYGLMDEVRLSNTPRSADWTYADYLSASNQYVSFGSELGQSASGWKFKDNATPAEGATVSSTLLSDSTVAARYTESNTTGVNPNAVTVGQKMEWDFALDPASAGSGTYYFRMAKADGSALDTYSNYPTLTIKPSLNQAAWRAFANADATDVGAALAAANTAATAPTQGTPFRLRTLVDVSTMQYDVGSPSMKLQYAARSGTCDTGFSGETYGDVAAGSGAIRYYDNTTPADGAAATSNGSDPTYLGHTKVMQSYEEANDATTVAAVPSGQLGAWDFSLVDFSATAATTYCFRLVMADGSTLDTYTSIPEMTTASGGNTAPSTPGSLAQYKSNGSTVIPTGGYTNETQVILKATVTDPETDNTSLCVEVGSSLTSPASPTPCGTAVTSGTTASVNPTGLVSGTAYKWQAKAKDAPGLYSAAYLQFNGGSTAFTVDTAAPATGTVYDGSSAGVDANYNDGSLSSISCNWSGFADAVSGIAQYDYSIGSTAGGTDIKTWTSNSTTTSVTATALTLRTGQIYFCNVRATDTAGTTSGVVSSNGQLVAPTLTFALGSPSIAFNSLTSINSYSDTETVTITTSTNAYSGYTVNAYRATTFASASASINDYAGTWSLPTTWSGTGFGYTSSDTSVQGSDRFSGATKYAGFSASAPGDVIADHTATVSGAPIAGESFTVTLKVAESATKPAGVYSTTLVLSCITSY